MKKIRFISLTAGFVLALAVSSCGGDNVVDLSNLQNRGGVLVVPETQKPYSGEFVVTYGNIIINSGTLKKGKLHGKFTKYEYSADLGVYQVNKIETYSDGVLNGKYEEYHPFWVGKEKIALVGNYKNGKPDGKWEEYDENGKIKETVNFKNGVKQ